MTKARLYSRRHTKKHSSQKETFISSIQPTRQHTDQQSQQNSHKDTLPSNVVDSPQLSTDQQSQQDIQFIQENWAIALSPLTSSIYTAVTYSILLYGFTKDNLPLLYTACYMATALLGPSALKTLIPLIRESFAPKDSKK
jgi:hypothetical protein